MRNLMSISIVVALALPSGADLLDQLKDVDRSSVTLIGRLTQPADLLVAEFGRVTFSVSWTTDGSRYGYCLSDATYPEPPIYLAPQNRTAKITYDKNSAMQIFRSVEEAGVLEIDGGYHLQIARFMAVEPSGQINDSGQESRLQTWRRRDEFGWLAKKALWMAGRDFSEMLSSIDSQTIENGLTKAEGPASWAGIAGNLTIWVEPTSFLVRRAEFRRTGQTEVSIKMTTSGALSDGAAKAAQSGRLENRMGAGTWFVDEASFTGLQARFDGELMLRAIDKTRGTPEQKTVRHDYRHNSSKPMITHLP